MRFLRVFAQQGLATNWTNLSPPLAKLLTCFDVNSNSSKLFEVSAYRVASELEELEAVAALFQIQPATPEKRFGIIVSVAECTAAGIEVDSKDHGNTGILAIDKRHFNLRGKKENFDLLAVHVVTGLWVGEQRLRVFSAQAILGQIAVFSQLPTGMIETETRTTCQDILGRVPDWSKFCQGKSYIEVHGKVESPPNHLPVVAIRQIDPTFQPGRLRRLWNLAANTLCGRSGK